MARVIYTVNLWFVFDGDTYLTETMIHQAIVKLQNILPISCIISLNVLTVASEASLQKWLEMVEYNGRLSGKLPPELANYSQSL